MPTSDPHLSKLRLTLTTTSSLLQQFLSSLSTTQTPPTPSNTPLQIPSQPPATDPLPILSTSSILIKAHTTKLSLLLLNPPFTPSAISTVLHDLSAGALPVLMTGVELCAPNVWGKVLASEVRDGVRSVLLGLVALVEEIEGAASGGKEVNGVSKALAGATISGPKTGVIDPGKGGQSRDSLACTGIIWDACDALVALQKKGLSGLVVDKAKEYRDVLDDAIKELREWSEEAANDEDEVEEEDNDFLSTPSLPARMRPFLMHSLKTLQRISLLYRAVMKHRLKTTPASLDVSSLVVSRIDSLMEILGDIPGIADDLASAFYDLDEESAKNLLEESCDRAKQAKTLASPRWTASGGEVNGEDDFSKWLEKWATEMERGMTA